MVTIHPIIAVIAYFYYYDLFLYIYTDRRQQ